MSATRKIAIVARAGTSALAPFHDPSWEIWGLPWILYPRLDCAFEIHTQQCVDESNESDDWIPRFRERHDDALVYCDPSRLHLFRRTATYPFDEIRLSLPRRYLENSIAYVLAYAIHLRPAEIGLYGVHMFAGYEAAFAQGSVQYLVGLADGRGIKVHIPPGSPLFMSNFVAGRYGVRGGEGAMREKIISYAGVKPYDQNGAAYVARS